MIKKRAETFIKGEIKISAKTEADIRDSVARLNGALGAWMNWITKTSPDSKYKIEYRLEEIVSKKSIAPSKKNKSL